MMYLYQSWMGTSDRKSWLKNTEEAPYAWSEEKDTPHREALKGRQTAERATPVLPGGPPGEAPSAPGRGMEAPSAPQPTALEKH